MGCLKLQAWQNCESPLKVVHRADRAEIKVAQGWRPVDPKAELAGYEYSPYSWTKNNPITYADPDGDIAPLVIAGIALAGGIINTASNWGNINSFAEGLNYFATGAAGYGVSTVNPLAGGLILAGGNLSIKAINGDLPQINSFGDFAAATATVGLDFLGPYSAGTALSTSWTSFRPTGYLSQAELTQLAKEGIRPSITQVAGTGLKKSVTEQVIKNTAVQTTNQVVQHSSKRLAQNLINAGIQRPLNRPHIILWLGEVEINMLKCHEIF